MQNPHHSQIYRLLFDLCLRWRAAKKTSLSKIKKGVGRNFVDF